MQKTSPYTLADCLAFAPEYIKPFDDQDGDQFLVILSVRFSDQKVEVRAFVDSHTWDAMETGYVVATGEHVCLADFEEQIEDQAVTDHPGAFRKFRRDDDDGYDPDAK